MFHFFLSLLSKYLWLMVRTKCSGLQTLCRILPEQRQKLWMTTSGSTLHIGYLKLSRLYDKKARWEALLSVIHISCIILGDRGLILGCSVSNIHLSLALGESRKQLLMATKWHSFKAQCSHQLQERHNHLWRNMKLRASSISHLNAISLPDNGCYISIWLSTFELGHLLSER